MKKCKHESFTIKAKCTECKKHYSEIFKISRLLDDKTDQGHKYNENCGHCQNLGNTGIGRFASGAGSSKPPKQEKDNLTREAKKLVETSEHFVCECNGMKHWCTSSCPGNKHVKPTPIESIGKMLTKGQNLVEIDCYANKEKINEIIDLLNK